MRIRRAAAIVFAVGVAVVTPAAASASTPATRYTKSYAGYYVPGTFGASGAYSELISSVTLPSLTPLAKVTNGVTTEYRLYSSAGEMDFQLSADPQTAATYTPVVEIPGRGKFTCNGTYPPGDVVQDEVFVNNKDFSPGSVIYWGMGDFHGNNTFCSFSFGSAQIFSKLSLVGAFNVRSFKAPASSGMLASFSQIGIADTGQLVFPLSDYPHGKYVATSTGTSTGVKRAVPSGLDSTGSAFTVSIP